MEDHNSAELNEVVSISIETAPFRAALAEIRAEWNKFIGSLGDADVFTAVGVGGFASMREQLSALRAETSAFNEDVVASAQNTAQQLGGLIQKIDALNEEAEERQRARAAETEEAEIDALEARVKAQERAAGAGSGRSGGAGGFFGGTSIASMALFVVQWKIISELISGVTAVLASPFKALQSGVMYMRELEARADELTGVLDANVRFSDDLADNFKRASEVAPQVVKALQDAGIAAHVDPSMLTNIFKALSNNGATAGVQDLKQLVDLATMFGVAFKGSGAQSMLRAVMEIQKAMEGTLPPTSKWLQVLGLTNDQWVQIRNEGLKYHDLVERIGNIPAMQAHREALGKMKEDQQSLLGSFDLLIKRIEAAGTQPLFERLSQGLRALTEWVEHNQDKITEGMRLFAQQLEDLTHISLDPIKTGFAGVAEIINTAVVAVGTLVIGFDALGKHISLLFSGNFSTEAWGKIGEQADAAAARLENRAERIQALLEGKQLPPEGPETVSSSSVRQATVSKRQSVTQQATHSAGTPDDVWGFSPVQRRPINPSSVPDWIKTGGQPVGGSADSRATDAAAQTNFIMDAAASFTKLHDHVENKTPPPPAPATPPRDFKREFDEQKADFLSDVEATKEKYKSLTDEIEKSVAARTLSHKAAAEQIAKYTKLEIAELDAMKAKLDQLADEDRKRILNSPAVTPEEIRKREDALHSYDRTRKAFDTGYSRSRSAVGEGPVRAQERGNSEEFQIEQGHFKALTALREDFVKQQLALVKFQAENGYYTEVEAFDKETELLRQQRRIRIEEDTRQLGTLGAGTQERAHLQDQMQRSTGQDLFIDINRSQERAAVEERERRRHEAEAAQLRASQLQGREEGNALLEKGGQSHLADEESLFAARSRDLELQITEKEQSLDIAQARNAESADTRKLTLELQNLYNERMKLVGQKMDRDFASMSGPSMRSTVAERDIHQGLNSAAQDNLMATALLGRFNDAHPQPANVKQMDPAVEAVRASLTAQVERTNDVLTQWNNLLAHFTETTSSAFQDFVNKVAGFDVKRAWDKAKEDDAANGDHNEELAVGIKAVAGAFKSIVNAAQTFEQGFKEGGVLGGAGSLASEFAQFLPGIAGTIASAVGSIMSTIGGLFVAASRHIAEDIQKQEQQTMLLYSTKQADLVNTIAALQNEEVSAITQLSGKKGGQDQLAKLLPQLQQQISQLQQQAEQTKASFESMTGDLALQNDTLSQINQQWEQINQQVADYLSAGGNVNTAMQALSETLHQMQIQATNNLNQANDQAVQDAISLNSLLEQRLQLQMQYNQQVFSVVNQGSIQRRAGAVSQGEQLNQLAAQYSQQMNDLNAQIGLAQQKVTLEGQVFSIASNINDLHRQDAELQAAALEQQILQWTALQKIVQSISQSASGGFTVAPGTFNPMPTTINLELQLAGYTLTATGTLQSSAPPSGNGLPAGAPPGWTNTDQLPLQLQQNLRQTLGLS